MSMNIKADLVKCKDLKAGDLFSTMGEHYWGAARHGREKIKGFGPVGEMAYIRTEEACPPDQADEDIYRLTIEK